MGKNNTAPCFICKKVWQENQADQFVVHGDRLACLDHPGVPEWHEEELEQHKKDQT